MLKRKLNGEQYDALDDALKPWYVKDGDDYKLNVEGNGSPDLTSSVSKLEKSLEAEREKRKQEAKAAAELRNKLNEIEQKKLLDGGDVEEIKKQFDEKLTQIQASLTEERDSAVAKVTEEMTSEITKYKVIIEESLVDNVAMKLANSMAADPEYVPAILPHIQRRLAIDWDAEKPSTRVLTGDGTISMMQLEDLEADIKNSKALKPLLKGSTGSGSSGDPANPQTPPVAPPTKDVDLSKADPASLVALVKSEQGE